MSKLKNSKRITLSGLAITIIVLTILATVGTTVGITNVREAKDAKLDTELEMVQHAILEQYVKFETTKDVVYLVGNKLEKSEVDQIAQELDITLVEIPDTYENKDYYKLDKASLKEIGIQNTDDEYIVNYISGEVINITSKKNDNKPLYTKADNFK